ncbi:hypothetical protein DVH24_003902 [Malus domestica]|uniref:Protein DETOXIFICATION n=1 Tax=Malus domestica TaxID=3750 RepID=A0A498K4R4_MALDO|nr:hypothetical protein DVH24_003902 [Malus domestica]
MAEEDGSYSYGNTRKSPICIFFKDCRCVLNLDKLGLEIASIALPAALALTADPIASLVDTAFIGQIGPVELAAVGVSIALFNQASRIAIFPLVSVTTSFVAEEDTIGTVSPEAKDSDYLETGSSINDEMKQLIPESDATQNAYNSKSVATSFEIVTTDHQKRYIPSASSAMVIGSILGLIQAIFLISGAKPLLNFMGVGSDSPMLKPAQQYLMLRSLGAPAVLLSLAMQGIFRGFKDTKTPLYATGFLLLMRVIAVTFCVTLAASLAARQGPTPMAAFQVCLQVWLATSLLADGLAVAGQAILASAFAKKDYDKATATASRVLQLGLVLGLMLAAILGVGLQYGARLFTKDVNVLHLIGIGIPSSIQNQFVAATQPINALAFVFDGVNFGASDFVYSAFSMASYGGYCQHLSSVCTLLYQWIHWNLGCFDHLYESSDICRILEDRNRNRTLGIPPGINANPVLLIRKFNSFFSLPFVAATDFIYMKINHTKTKSACNLQCWGKSLIKYFATHFVFV